MAMKRTKKLTMYSIMLLTVALMTISCKSEIKVFSDSPMVTQVRQIKGFERVEIVGSPTVYYQQGDTYSVKVKGPEDLVDKIVTEKEDETLIIRNKGKFGIVNINMMGNDQLEVHVTSQTSSVFNSMARVTLSVIRESIPTIWRSHSADRVTLISATSSVTIA